MTVGRKVTIGLSMPWPCVTDFVVYPPTGSRTKDQEHVREMSTFPKLTIGHGQHISFLIHGPERRLGMSAYERRHYP